MGIPQNRLISVFVCERIAVCLCTGQALAWNGRLNNKGEALVQELAPVKPKLLWPPTEKDNVGHTWAAPTPWFCFLPGFVYTGLNTRLTVKLAGGKQHVSNI